MEQAKGLILINTGTGKGKTTAALGTAIRAWGDGQKVLILQFIKGAWKYGELKAIESLGKINGNIEIRPMGDGFVFHNKKEDEESYLKKKELAKQAWNVVVKEVKSDEWDLIILDEASASTDPENEYELQIAFKELIKDRTTIMIAHRLSSIRGVDEILLVEDGKILERGSHDELMKEDSRYKKFIEMYNEANEWRVDL